MLSRDASCLVVPTIHCKVIPGGPNCPMVPSPIGVLGSCCCLQQLVPTAETLQCPVPFGAHFLPASGACCHDCPAVPATTHPPGSHKYARNFTPAITAELHHFNNIKKLIFISEFVTLFYHYKRQGCKPTNIGNSSVTYLTILYVHHLFLTIDYSMTILYDHSMETTGTSLEVINPSSLTMTMT